MSTLATQADLHALIHRLNFVTARSPNQQFRLRQDTDGYCLHLGINNDGGVHCPLGSSYLPAGEAYQVIHAFLQGILWTTANRGQP